MKSNVAFFVLGVAVTTGSFCLYSTIQSEKPETYAPTYITNNETGTSARNMEADIVYFDTDGDGDEENVLLYSCQGCNAPPREMAIIDDGELVFYYEGGNLEFIPDEAGSFIVNEANIPRDGRRIETEFHYDDSNASYRVVEILP